MTPDDPQFVRIPGAPDHTTGNTGTTGNTSNEPQPERERAPRSRDMRRLEEQLTDAYTQVGVILGIIGGKTGNLAGFIVVRRSEMLAGAWIDLAERDAKVKRAIQSILQAGGWAGVATAHAGILLPIAAMSGVLPEAMAEKIMLGLAVQDPELFAHLTAQASAMSNGVGH